MAAGDLQAALSRQQGGAVAEERCLDWLIQLALALKSIHDRRILHRLPPLCSEETRRAHVPTAANVFPALYHRACALRAGITCRGASRLACSQALLTPSDARRDFKTANIFMAEGGALKVGDFGVSTVLTSTLALARTAIGTPYYISPEICMSRPYNAKVLCASLLRQCIHCC